MRRAVALARAGVAASVDQALEWTDVELLAYTQIASELTEEEQQAFEDARETADVDTAQDDTVEE